MKAAIIGTGRMGRRHIKVVRELGLELVGVGDQRVESLALAGEEHGVPLSQRFTDIAALLESTTPAIVIIATTAPSHCKYTCMAAEAGAKYILCEKPMATSLAECDLMLATCRQYGVELAVNHPARFTTAYVEPKRIVQSEAFGGLSSVTVIAGNVGIAMNGTHFFEMFRYTAEEAPVEVTAWFSEQKLGNPRGPEFEDRAGSVRLVTASGKRFYLEAGADQGHGVQTIYAGPYGQVMLDFDGTMRVAMREEQYRHLPTTNYAMPEVSSTQMTGAADVIAPSEAVLEALLERREPPTGADGRLAVAVLVAAHISDENGHIPVELSEADLHKDRLFPWA